MTPRIVRVATIATALFCSQRALAQDVIENVVVRNRLFTTKGRPEAGVNLGLTLQSGLTEHYNLNAHFAYNLGEYTAVEVRAGYALTRQTNLASQIREHFLTDSAKKIDDLANMWEMTGNASLGFRWSPIYGKVSLLSELPVHFQAYLWLGAGAAMFQRESIVICVQGSGSTCNEFLSEDKIGPMGVGALGLRLFLTPAHSVTLELRDYAYPDSYRVEVERAAALGGNPGSNFAKSPGVTQLVQLDLGYSFLF